MSPTAGGRRRLGRPFFAGDVTRLARNLLGMVLLKDDIGGVVVEAEAYHQSEASSHAHGGLTERNKSLFLAPGHLYVYRIHQSLCANVSACEAGTGAGVLIRALLPTDGRDVIADRRGGKSERIWTDGPGKLCAALDITTGDDGQDLTRPGPVLLVDRGVRYADSEVQVGPRVGISKARDLPWRFLVTCV